MIEEDYPRLLEYFSIGTLWVILETSIQPIELARARN
jgi:hypothetical protein